MVRIVTDSGANLPHDLLQQYDIAEVPLRVIFGEKTYRDNVDITNEQFYGMLRTAKEHPTTSQPSPEDFAQVYRGLLDRGHEIVSLHISSKLSGTYQSASSAKSILDAERGTSLPITVIDSLLVSMGLGLVVIAAAQAAQASQSRAEIEALATALSSRVHIVFLVDTLEYLRRGGRIGNAQAFFGTLLNVKPLLEIRHGQVEPLERVRSRAAGLKRLLEITSEALGRAPAQFAVLHAEAPEEAAALEKELRTHCNCAQVYTTEIGPAIGRHSGPDAVGIAFYRE